MVVPAIIRAIFVFILRIVAAQSKRSVGIHNADRKRHRIDNDIIARNEIGRKSRASA